ncbi:ACP S-malonyltransferase [Mobilicoccus caccae]|uniref:[acyl-carrier-protein] S-malonyltransferase n=1 Tax=Mobilicoccus caccae TaxID=1859295 RepID=A0ABQ6IN63_9MICO|nr:ACP S-malonyltransferase [Mobilicoccus caccae]GMA39355.1 ACP S-malonyltransferase [Mobilicoccus caccae]
MLVIVCPGQGAQVPGLLTPWLEVPGLRGRLEAYAEAADVDLLAHGTTSDADTIRDTAVAQPLIVASGLLSLTALLDPEGAEATDVVPTPPAVAVAGHSVGEFTAAAISGAFTPATAMRLVGVRGRAMAGASGAHPTGMSAVLGGKPEEVLAAIEEHGLTPANVNGAGQVVAAGDLEALAALGAAPPARTRVVPLSVAGAFHTSYMASAVQALDDAAGSAEVADPRVPVVSNRDGQEVTSGTELVRRLVDQVSNPVRWDLCMERFAALGVTGILELVPSGTLVGLAKRGLKDVERFALAGPDTLDDARAFVQAHQSENA